VAVQRDLHQHRIAQSQRQRVQAHGIALDHARLFHLPDARPAGRGAQAHGRADFLQAGPRVGLQGGKNLSIEGIHGRQSTAKQARLPAQQNHSPTPADYRQRPDA
jgi:hypothetical protein